MKEEGRRGETAERRRRIFFFRVGLSQLGPRLDLTGPESGSKSEFLNLA